ncbi:GNAT family protein [uncultured Corynebacterium sp.]|uniref:GNAT family N-acetyltransferase n=1 Tax=uncultured Corynebacterium sp. TaxID=159447 RepID=UPI0025F6D7F3|nr:GNAT family protein [uncultured Corynebacterium sp.]
MLHLFGRRDKPATGPRDGVHPGWPEATVAVTLASTGQRVRLRPMSRTDAEDWRQMRLLDEPYLRPVEPTAPAGWEAAHSKAAWSNHFGFLRASARDGVVVPLAIEVDGNFAGQVTLGNIQHGAIRECWIGYWVFSQYHGAGVATAACALGVDHAFSRVGMHRVTATYLPDNPASGRVLLHCGFREEGYLRRNLHIDGQWRDHHFVALNADDFASSAVARLVASGRLRAGGASGATT